MSDLGDDDVHPTTAHAIRVSYAMYRAFYDAIGAAVVEGGKCDFDSVPDEMLRLLRSWGIEVVELPSWPFMPGPPQEAGWPEDNETA